MDERWYNSFWNNLMGANLKRKNSEPEEKAALPMNGGRSSVPEPTGTMGGILGDLILTDPNFPIEFLDALTHLAMYNADVSYAVDNIVQLGNTDYDIFFDDSVSDEQAKEMKKHIKRASRHWYNYTEGINSLINDLLAQVAITGALSAEMIPTKGLDGIDKVVLVNTKSIRFLYNEEHDRYVPYQSVSTLTGAWLADGGYKELNEVTYKYLAIRRFNEKPYAIPPFLSAIESLEIDADLKANLKSVIKKLGILGFLHVLVNAPMKKQGLDDATYFKEAKTYLDAVVPEIEKGLSKGYVVGFKGQHEFKMEHTTTDVKGARELFDLNAETKMAGLKQDPMMLGRAWTTTETLGRVLLAKLATQITNYQKLVAGFLSELIRMELTLVGYQLDYVEVEFDQPMLGDETREQEAMAKKIENATSLYNAGIISQVQRAQMLDYDKPDQEEPRMMFKPVDPSGSDNDSSDPSNPSNDDDPTDGKTTTKNVKQMITEYKALLGGYSPEYDYGHVHGNDKNAKLLYMSKDSKVDDYIIRYKAETAVNYSEAIKKAIERIGREVRKLGEGATVDRVTDVVFYHLYKNWEGDFKKPQRKTVAKWVSEAYADFRKNSAIFGGKTIAGEPIPAGVLNLLDIRAIEFFKNSDNLYMGKFITDQDTVTRMNKFIKETYLDGNMPIGNNKAVMDEFKARFGNFMEGEEFKLYRVLTTSVNLMRNAAAVNYMQQAEVEEFIIQGVNDSLQCSYCAEMQDRVFSVKTTIKSFESLYSGDAELIKETKPFITSVFKTADDIKGLSDEQIQQQGISAPPYHPNCRDVIVAKL